MAPWLTAVLVCAAAAAFEGICAGANVKSFFRTLKFPRYAAPLWLWSIIGGLYYLLFGFLLYRLFGQTTRDTLWFAVLALIVFLLVLNGAANYVIFRMQDLRRSFILGAVFPFLDAGLFAGMLALDRTAALWMIPYLVYRVYGVWWGYALMKVNATAT